MADVPLVAIPAVNPVARRWRHGEVEAKEVMVVVGESAENALLVCIRSVVIEVGGEHRGRVVGGKDSSTEARMAVSIS
jgi:hypothetical protein